MVSIAGLLLFAVSALRSREIGTDTPSYAALYEQIIDRLSTFLTWRGFYKGYEPGFVIFVLFTRYIFGSNPQWLLVVTSFIIVFSACYFFYKNSLDPFLSLIIYVLFMCWFDQLNTMRAALAYSIIFLNFDRLKKKQYFGFVISVLLASLFHRVAFIFLLLIPLSFIKVTKKNGYIFGGIGLALSVLCRPLFFFFVKFLPGYSVYSEVYSGTNFFGAVFMLAIPLLIFLSFCFVFSRVYPKFPKTIALPLDTDFSLLLKILFLFTFLTSLTLSATILLRLASPFNFVIPLFIPYLLDFLNKNKKRYYSFFYPGILICFFAYFVIVAKFRPSWTSCAPYAFFWMNNYFPSIIANGPSSSQRHLLFLSNGLQSFCI